MKLFIAGVKRGWGIGKQSNNAYDINTAFCLERIVPGKFGGMTVEGYGFEKVDMPLVGGDLIKKFQTIPLPAVVEIVTGVKNVFGEYKTSIVDIVVPPAPKAA